MPCDESKRVTDMLGLPSGAVFLYSPVGFVFSARSTWGRGKSIGVTADGDAASDTLGLLGTACSAMAEAAGVKLTGLAVDAFTGLLASSATAPASLLAVHS